MTPRPRIALAMNPLDYTLEALGAVVLLVQWVGVVYYFEALPAVIPVHYNGAGVADGFGDRWMILTLPALATVLYAGLTALTRFPHVLNYAVEITLENARVQYGIAVQMLRQLKVSVVLLFGALAFQTIRHAQGATEGLGAWFLPAALALVLAPVGVGLVRASRAG
jgi:uncharacterized membrane protein